MIPTPRVKRTHEQSMLVAQTRGLDAVVFAMMNAKQITPTQRDIAGDNLTRARLTAEAGNMAEARQIVARVADLIVGWQEGKT
jgi:hypothetical protein